MKSWAGLIKKTRQVFGGLPDARKGKNTSYSMEDFATSVLSVFFTQSPSFLAYQAHFFILVIARKSVLCRRSAPAGAGSRRRDE